jgi:uncharacterized protein (TIGR03086 family)
MSTPMTPATTLDVPELYRRASTGFAARVHGIAGRWAAPTPCADWDVRALVRHVVEEEHWAPHLLAGQTIAQVGDQLAGDLLGIDPISAYDAAAAAAEAAVAEPEAMHRTVHLSFGDVPGSEYAMQLAADHLVHTWDLAVALDLDPTLDHEAVAAVHTWFGPMEDTYRGAGLIGPRTQLPAGSGQQDELLAMFGRTPVMPAADALGAVERFNRAFDSKDVDAVMAAMTPDCVFEDTTPPDGRRHTGAAAVRAAWEELFTASPHGVFTTEELIPAGERVIARWRYDFGGGHVRGVDVFTVRNGLVAEKLSYVKG